LAAVRALPAGERALPAEIARAVSAASREQRLTSRERQVLERVAEGGINRDVGRSLGITEGTAGLYVSSILGKLGARTRTEAVTVAQRRGILRGLVGRD
jgi:two-component system NarL family response regulator